MSKPRRNLKLRDYQARALLEIMMRLNAGLPALLVAPTGAGKTEIIAGLCDRLPRHARVLVIQHLIDLVAQNGARFAQYLDRNIVTLANSLPKRFQLLGDASKANIVVGTVDSVLPAIEYLGWFDAILVDEAHHSICRTYMKIIEALRKINPKLAIVGTTATAERADRYGLDVLFGDAPIVITLKEMIESGWLVPPRVLSVPLEDLLKLKRAQQQSDDDDHTLSKALNVQLIHNEVIRNYMLHGEGRQFIFFCADVAHSDGLAEAFRKAAPGLNAQSVSYQTPVGARTELLREFSAGMGPRILCNPFLLTEGFDPPPVGGIGLLRAFSGKSTLIQAVGRGLRPHPGKVDCLVLDFVAALPRHGDLIAGIDLRTKRKSGGGGGGGGGPGDPTEVGYNEANLEPYELPGIPEATFVRPAESASEDEASEPTPEMVDGEPIVTRAEAVARGLKRYFTGKACKYGHISHRYMKGQHGHCFECLRLHEKARRLDPSKLARIKEREGQRTQERRGMDRLTYDRVRMADPTVRSKRNAQWLASHRARMKDPAYAEKFNNRRKKYQQKYCAKRVMKLTEEQAVSIIIDGRRYAEIANEHGVSVSTVCEIKKGKTWKHLSRRQ
jgi:superfamily II DNA or RNA helicase